jgi:hypothetical protein
MDMTNCARQGPSIQIAAVIFSRTMEYSYLQTRRMLQSCSRLTETASDDSSRRHGPLDVGTVLMDRIRVVFSVADFLWMWRWRPAGGGRRPGGRPAGG